MAPLDMTTSPTWGQLVVWAWAEGRTSFLELADGRTFDFPQSVSDHAVRLDRAEVPQPA